MITRKLHMAQRIASQTRREFLNTTASGLGMMGLGSILAEDGMLSAANAAPTDDTKTAIANPLAAKPAHFDPKAKACIFIFMAGAPSHIDLFDQKPILKKRHGEPLPESMLKNIRFAFIKKDKALLQGSPYKFQKHGECGM